VKDNLLERNVRLGIWKCSWTISIEWC